MQPTLQVWLKRRASPKKLRTALKRSGRVRPVSKRRAKQNREYTVVRREYLTAHPTCQHPGCVSPATEIHHRKGRIGELLTNTRFFLAVCRPHHDYIHQHPKESRQIGLLA